jgi:predicted small integral membrane protein
MMAIGPLEWMAWTTPTAIFFIAIVVMLGMMALVSIRSPSLARKGFLPIATTRGDRLYIGLITTAFINLFWLGLTDLSQLGAVAICVAWLIVVLRWG